jgi:hypothetical protein
MSTSYIPLPVRYSLWGIAAGRCQYEGCNKPLWVDSLTKKEGNYSYIAHIIADSPDGPRGDEELSKKLAKDISNLMLLCDEHHRLIDRIDVEGHPVERLKKMKEKHEKRIELVTSMPDDLRTHVLLYGANIGKNGAPLSMEKAKEAIYPNRFPAENKPINLSMKNSVFYDDESMYWILEKENLNRQFNTKVKQRLTEDIQHLSVFGLAPQPLLIELGRLLSDITTVDIYQLHREPANWKWQENPDEFDYIIKTPPKITAKVALNLSLSADIDNSRIQKVLGDNVSIWTLTIESPSNDFLKSKEQLKRFREVFRNLLNEIKREHGHDNVLHVFPSVPVAVAIEIGRVWMPKADLPLILYDENRSKGGFIHTFDIKYEPSY